MTNVLSLILLASLPFQFAIPFWLEMEIPLARGLAAVLCITFIVTAASRRDWQLPAPLVTGMILSCLGIAGASILWAAYPERAIPKIFLLWNILPLIFVWYDLLWRNESSRVSFTKALVYGAAVSATIGLMFFLAQFLFGVSETFHFLVDRVLPFFLGKELGLLVASYPSLLVNIDGETILRVSAFFPDPHVAAYFFGMTGFLALGMARLTGAKHYLWLAALIFLADSLTFSRGGYVGLFFGGMIYGLLLVPLATRDSLARAGGVILVGLFCLLIFGQPILSRFSTTFSFSDTSSLERLSLWRESLVSVAQHPVLGVGLGNYISSVRPLYAIGTPFYAHNLYLDIALEIGLIGLFAFLGICLYALNLALKTRMHDPLAPALAAVFTLYLTHSLFETALYSLHVTLILAYSFALALSLKRPPIRTT